MSDVIEIDDGKFKFKINGWDRLLEIDQATVPQEIAHQNKLQKVQKGGNDLKSLYEANLQYLIDLNGDEEILKGLSRAGFVKVLDTVAGVNAKK